MLIYKVAEPTDTIRLVVTAPAGVVTKTPLNDVSSGYRTILAMVCDIMQRLMDRRINPDFPGLEHAQAVVLIDEVEAHLQPGSEHHRRTVWPRWQWTLKTISAFPQTMELHSLPVNCSIGGTSEGMLWMV
jgi:predicted ATP-binding protein involved in virulence